MSELAAEKAKALLERHIGMKIPIDIERIAEAEGCELIEWSFVKPVEEVKRGRWIGLARGLQPRERRHLVAHALAHHLLHCDNQLSFHNQRQGSGAKQEREAEACAAHILIPASELDKVISLSVWEIADHFEVPAELAYRRINDFATQDEMERWDNACGK